MAFGGLAAVRQQPFYDRDLSIFSEFGGGFTTRAIDTADLLEFKFDIAIFGEFKFCNWIQNFASAWTGAVMLLDVTHLGIFANMKSMNTVMNGVVCAAVVNPATGNNRDFAVFTDEKFVVNYFLVPGSGNNYRDVDGFVLRIGQNVNVKTATVFLRANVNVGGALAADGFAVQAEVVSAERDVFSINGLFDLVINGGKTNVSDGV